MKLISARVRSYRIHGDLRVDFDDARTLIGGPNESGKSTLAEAIHRALFLRAKTTGDTREKMVSSMHGGHPEVEVEFACGASRYVVRKRFSGQNGTCTLTETGGTSLSGDEAEAQLAQLLGVTATAGARGVSSRLADLWGHLWVYQGTAGDDPLGRANQHRDLLMQRLQSIGGAALMQSNRDMTVAGLTATRYEETFVKSGAYKRDSAVARAVEALTDATSEREASQALLEQLDEALQDFEEAEQLLRDNRLGDLETEKRQIDARAVQLTELRHNLAAQSVAFESAKRDLDNHTGAENELLEIQQNLARERTRNEPIEGELKALRESEAAEARRANVAEAALAAAHEATREHRRSFDIAGANLELRRLAGEDKALDDKRVQVERHRAERAANDQQRASLPEVSPTKLKSLRKLEQARDQAATKLAAMAAGLEVISTDRKLISVDREYRSGERYVLDEDTELLIGKTVRIRITPGGGTSLKEARLAAHSSQQELIDALNGLSLTTVESAAEVVERRRQIDSADMVCEAALEALEADRLEEEIGNLATRRTSLRNDLARRQALGKPLTLKKTLAAAEIQRDEIEDDFRKAESAEDAATIALRTSRAALEVATHRTSTCRETLDQSQQSLRQLETRWQLLVKQHGTEVERAQTLIATRKMHEAASASLGGTKAQIESLQPALVQLDQDRIVRAIETARSTRDDAIKTKASAESLLQRDGATDPREKLAFAIAREAGAKARASLAASRAEALKLLHRLFTEQQQRLAKQFTQPLAARAEEYLAPIFGPGVKVDTEVDETNAFRQMSVARAGVAPQAFVFDILSGGAREQVATGFRLAMAEILAESHNGSLPVVLDDAFAYSDSDRVQGVQRMLDLAASRGIQVVVLSCNPADYSGFGAKTTSLRLIKEVTRLTSGAPSTQPVLVANDAAVSEEPPSTVSDSESGDQNDAGPPPDEPDVTPERCGEFLTALRDAGGSRGNGTLRATLGWTEELYFATKQHLVDHGSVVTGRGRGGSVALTP